MKTIPENIKEAIDRHVEHGDGCFGGFVRAVLENDLKGAVGQADESNLPLLIEIVGYCYNEIPGPCWGSKEKVAKWKGTNQNKGNEK